MASNQQFFAPRVYQPKTRISGHVALCPFKRTSEVNDSAVLPQLGLDYKKMEIPVIGRTMRLVEQGDGPMEQILS